ncbi:MULTISPECIES: hypothetical protein [Ralstonia]|jgi:hypothetical protein|nr:MULTISPECIES: hypothetical protein [Ralstonia]MBL4778689.1 hypothetical protein [Ralstonia sp.]MCM3580659.1 hypothetical protein [Ralstonia pickettii]
MAKQTGAHRQLRSAMLGLSIAAAVYPYLLRGFHTFQETVFRSALSALLEALFMTAVFAVPAIGLLIVARLSGHAPKTRAEIRVRRFAYMTVASPTIFVFFGVVWYMCGTPIEDIWVWPILWIAIALWIVYASDSPISVDKENPSRWRMAHGIAGSLALVYVLFHVANHLFGLSGPDAHAAVMKAGRIVYRSPLVQPLLVMGMLFQVFTGIRLALFWSTKPAGFHRVFQVATGFYLSLFIVGHMNSVFIFARTFLKIDTDWAFASGAPAGLVHDVWNNRLIPHYALGVFFVLSHLASGLRVVLLHHGANQRYVNRVWNATVVLSAVVAIAVSLALTGLRLPHG